MECIIEGEGEAHTHRHVMSMLLLTGMLSIRYNSKRRNWRRTKLGI